MRKRDIDWIVRRKGNGFIIPSDRIRVGPWGNARTDITPEMVESRARSLVKDGQKEPVKGLFSADMQWFELIDGELRLRGWKFAKTNLNVDLDKELDGIYCELQPGFERAAPTKRDIIKLQVAYGTGSIPLSDYDKATSVAKLIEMGETVKDLAILMHCTEQTVRNYVQINSVPERIKQKVKPTTALRYSRATVPDKQNVEKKIESGEKVRAKDIPTRIESQEKVDQEQIPVELPEKRRLSDDDIRNDQIIKADYFRHHSKNEKERHGWIMYKRALKSVIGEEVPL